MAGKFIIEDMDEPQFSAGKFVIEDAAPLSALDAGGALASGVNHGVIAGLGGLPAKVGADIIDLGTAAYGTAGRALGLLEPQDMPEPLDRSKVFMSPEWITNKLQGNSVTAAAINNPRPDLRSARLLNAGGNAVGASLAGRPADMAMQLASGVAGQGATEAGASPAWAMVASMTPQLGVTGAQGATRGAVRGGEQGRLEMEQRIRDFEAAGVDPTVGLATGGRTAQAIESALAKAPGGAGVMAKKIEDIQAQLQGTANLVRDTASPVYGPVAAGEALRHGAEAYKDRRGAIYGTMMDRAMDLIPEGMTFPVSGMMARGEATLADVPGAPNVSGVLNQPRAFTQRVVQALERDATPQPSQNVPSQILQADGQPFTTQTRATPGGLPMEGIRGLRSRIGELAYAQNPLNADANTGALKNLYGGARQDIRNAGTLADAERVARGQNPGVAQGLDRADRFYSQTQRILDDVLAPIHKTAEGSPERAYARVESDMRNSGQSAVKLMSALPLENRKLVLATAIDRLGRARPGAQNADGDAFSASTFLTNWNKMSPEAKKTVTWMPNGSAMRDQLDMIARAADRLGQASKVYSNPSGTAQATNAVGAISGLASGLSLAAAGHVGAGLMSAGGILGTMAIFNVSARTMSNPRFVKWLADSTKMRPQQIQQHLARLSLMATRETDPEARAELQELQQRLAMETAGN
jgi:hypothetical protein